MSEFNVQKEYILEDDFVILRPLKPEDYALLLPFAIDEPELWKYSLLQGGGEDGMKNYIRIAMEAREKGNEYPFIVFDKRKNKYAGSTRFYDIQLFHKTLQLGYTWYGKEFQGTGLNKHCKFLLLQFAFEELGMERVEFRADNSNQRSIAAMKSIGCIIEGVLRSNTLKHDGFRRNSIVLSILKEEWERSVKNDLKEKL
jgi:N-acetyltransferase